MQDSLDSSKLHFAMVGATRTRYYDAGAGPPLLLLHGGDLGSVYSLDSWSLNLPGLARMFRVIAPDKLGSGYTDNPATAAEYEPESLLAHIRAFLLTLHTGPLHVVGHSRGGALAAWLALAHPELVQSLVLVDTSSTAPADTTQPRVQNEDFYERLGHRQRQLVEEPSLELVRTEPLAQAFNPEQVTDDFLARMLAIARLPKVRAAQRYIRSIRETRWRPALERQRALILAGIDGTGLAVPTLVVWGYNDRSAPRRLGYTLFERIAARTPRSELLVLNQAGHYSFRDQPAAFNAALERFLQVDSTGGTHTLQNIT